MNKLLGSICVFFFLTKCKSYHNLSGPAKDGYGNNNRSSILSLGAWLVTVSTPSDRARLFFLVDPECCGLLTAVGPFFY